MSTDGIPLAPIQPAVYGEWTNAYRLANGAIEAVVVPETGRILHLGFAGGRNLLRLKPRSEAEPSQPAAWRNAGGDWIWPAAQSRWPSFQGTDWPPSPLLDGRPWTGRGWRSTDGGRHCMIEQEYGAPLNIRVSRTISVVGTSAVVTIRQRIEQLEPATVPVTLWNVTQLADVDAVILPVETNSAFPGGIKVFPFGDPADGQLIACGDIVVYDAAQGGEHKLGSDSPRAWVAARRGDTVVLARRQAPADETGAYPDGGCTVEFYSNRGLGYAEIETLSVERILQPGETLDRIQRLELHRVPGDIITPCDLADHLRGLLGEVPAPPPAPAGDPLIAPLP